MRLWSQAGKEIVRSALQHDLLTTSCPGGTGGAQAYNSELDLSALTGLHVVLIVAAEVHLRATVTRSRLWQTPLTLPK